MQDAESKGETPFESPCSEGDRFLSHGGGVVGGWSLFEGLAFNQGRPEAG